MVSRGIKILGILILIIGGLYLWVDQSRSFYCLADGKCVTVWKRAGGKCYIIAEKYYGLLVPDEYIETKNLNAITLLFDNQSNYDYILSNDYGKCLEINAPSVKIKYFPYENRDDFAKSYYLDDKIKEGIKYLQIDIGENLAVLNGAIQ